MKFAGVFTRIIAPIMAALGRVMAYIRGGKSRTITDGFHVTRDGRVTYKSRSMRSYERKLHRWGRSAAMRTGGPKLTGDRLLRAARNVRSAGR
jgi:hypothetical protein